MHSLSNRHSLKKKKKGGGELFLEGVNRGWGVGWVVGSCKIVNVSDVCSLYNLIPDNGTSNSVCQCLFTHK